MRIGLSLVLFIGCFATVASADSRVRYPRVYGATGRPYGPTQAHYQYERRYGRPWHGYGGQTVSRRRFYYSSPQRFSAGNIYYPPVVAPFGYGYGFSTFGPTVPFGYGGNFIGGGVVGAPGFYDYGPVYSYTPMAPQAIQAYPQWIGRNPFNNEVLRQGQIENDVRWKLPLRISPKVVTPIRKPTKSTPAARMKSITAQARGDRYMEEQKYGSAYERYRVAFQAAPERAAPYFRTGFALVAMNRYTESIKYFKRGLQLDPNWPTNGESLGKIYGRKNGIAKTAILGNATRWAKQDIRDPERLFVLGVLLHFDNQTDKSPVLFEAAYRLAGGGEHLKAFLRVKKYVAQAKKAGTIAPKVFEVKPQQTKKAKPLPNLEPPRPPIPGRPKKKEATPLVPPLPK